MSFSKQSVIIAITIVLLILTGLAGVISKEFPGLGIVLTIVGVFLAIWRFIAGEVRNRNIDRFFDAQACLMAYAGIGNPYTQIVKNEIRKTGKCANAKKHLEKALQVHPDDLYALMEFSRSLTMDLTLKIWARKDHTTGRKQWDRAIELARRGHKLKPKEYAFMDILGVLYDEKGDHVAARKWFMKSSKLRTDPYWHLLLSTSYGKTDETSMGSGLSSCFFPDTLHSSLFVPSSPHLDPLYISRRNSAEVVAE